MVAKSFQSFEMVGEPYESNGKMYINTCNPKTGKTRVARWYTDKEYAKLYPEEKVEIKPYGPQKGCLGFEKGYITIFKNVTSDHEEFFKFSNARYATFWGWYVVSTEELPSDIPAGIEPVQLYWDEVGDIDGYLKNDEIVKSAVDAKLYPASNSEWVGSVGERIEIKVKVVKNTKKDTQYGTSSIHEFEDENGNVLSWITAAKDWPVGSEKKIRGTVKEHKIYRNKKITYLTRCMEI